MGLTPGPPAGVDGSTGIRPTGGTPGSPSARTFAIGLSLVLTVSVALVAWFGRRSFPFSDDFVFLIEARTGSLTWDYLASPMFGHFSPVSRLVHLGVAAALPSWAGLTTVVLIALGAAVVLSVGLLMTSLFGRSWTTLAGIAAAGPTLSLLPLVNWYTAGVNIMPAIAGFAVCWAGVVQLVRGRARWWGLVAVAGYLVAVLSWELGITAPAFIGLWLLLCRSRVTSQSLLALLRRTWMVWAVLTVIGLASVVNYRVGYYVPSPRPAPGLAAEALAVSAFDTLLPLAVGWWYSPSPTFGVILGAVALAVVLVVGLVRSGQAWRGWVIALAGWSVPVMALVLSRVGYIGVATVEQPMYFYLPTMVVVVGLLESLVATPRQSWRAHRETRIRSRPWTRTLAAFLVLAAVVAAVGYRINAWAVISATNYGAIGQVDSPRRYYLDDALDSVRDLGRDQAFSVLDRRVPEELIDYQGHNRLSQILGLYDPSLVFNAPTGPWWEADAQGDLRPARLQSLATTDLGAAQADRTVTVTGATSTRVDPVEGLCLQAGDGPVELRWQPITPVTGNRLVVMSEGRVSADSPVTVSVTTPVPLSEDRGVPTTTVVADANPRPWAPAQAARLDTLSTLDAEPAAVSGVALSGFAASAETCIARITLASVVV